MEFSLFPHESIRPIQNDMLQSVKEAIDNKESIVMHAPTGIGKTAATIAPALEYALKNDKTVFFLTSRHTQHKIVIDTLKIIEKKYNEHIVVADIIGKKWLCPTANTTKISSSDFIEYCKNQREKDLCGQYLKTINKNKLTTEGKLTYEKARDSIMDSEELMEICETHKVCPYEILIKLASTANIIVADYYYIFNPIIQENFFAKTGKKLEDSIIIVDEGHNLPIRIRELMTNKLSTFIVSRAEKEVQKYGLESVRDYVDILRGVLGTLSQGVDREKIVDKEEFISQIEEYQQVMASLEFAADDVRDQQRSSFIGSISSFMDAWLEGEDEGFVRFIEVGQFNNERTITLQKRCLDPALITKPIIKNSHSTILMSGTLSPTVMYKDILGFPSSTIEKSFESPFPKNNRLTMVVPKTTTKYSARSEEQYKEIAKITAEICNSVPGNTAVFFPSYRVMEDVSSYFNIMCEKTIFSEKPRMNKNDKNSMLESFKKYKKIGAVLLGVAAANFSEGIDLPGDFLKGVIVVGLPLQPPNLEVKELIKYYETRFGNGWDYGYVLPAITKSMQAAGRCIRSENDKGIVVFLDQRYTWPNYFKCFPTDWDLKITVDYKKATSEFFKQ